jgi:hypothetical protein
MIFIINKQWFIYIRSEVLTGVVTKSSIFWDLTQYIPLNVDQCSSEKLVEFQWTACHYIPEDRNLKSFIYLENMIGANVRLHRFPLCLEFSLTEHCEMRNYCMYFVDIERIQIYLHKIAWICFYAVYSMRYNSV